MDLKKDKDKEIIKAFKYVSYSELSENKLDGKFKNFKKLIQKKLGNKYNDFFQKLKNDINNQENFAEQLKLILDKFFKKELTKLPKKQLIFSKLINKQNLARKECLMLPFITLHKMIEKL